MQTLGVLDVDGLDVGVQALLGALLVVTLAGDADAQAERDTLDAGLPDLLVQGGVKTDVLGALLYELVLIPENRSRSIKGGSKTYHSMLGKSTDLLDGTRSTLLEANTVAL